MSKIVKSVFGGTDDSAQKAQTRANTASQQFTKAQGAQARADVLRLFPAAQEAQQRGFQSALDIFGQTIPQQLGAFQQGSVGAQEALIQGLDPFRAAILGQPVDFGKFQPRTVDFSTSFAQQQLPTAPVEQAPVIGQPQPRQAIGRPRVRFGSGRPSQRFR